MTGGAGLLDPAQAEAIVRERVTRLPVESRPLASLAGAVLAQPVTTERDQPPFDRVTMDGIAFSSRSWRDGTRTFRVTGTQAAGDPALALEQPAGCIEVMTGAILPIGCDCVVPIERLTVVDGRAKVDDDVPVAPQLNVHTRGLDARAGETLLERGTRLTAPGLAVLASCGLPRADVYADPRIMIVTTGDELVPPGEPIAAWQVRRSNSEALRGALILRGYLRVGEDHLPDDLAAMQSRLATHLATHDLVVLTGGVSMGRFDHVPAVLRELGVAEVFHKVAQRPGKPVWFGIGAQGQTVFGLPGNPVSALVCLLRYVVPALAAMNGAAPATLEHVALSTMFAVKPALWFFLPVKLAQLEGGGMVANPQPTRGSGDFVSLLGTDGFVELPPGPAEFPAGHLAPLYRW
jgi:molybdopterin molybdotransferase